MEYITVLKHPRFCSTGERSIVKSDKKFFTEVRKVKRGGRRLCSYRTQSYILGGLLLLHVFSFSAILWLYLHVQTLNEQVQDLQAFKRSSQDIINELRVQSKRVELQQSGNEKDSAANRNSRHVSSSVAHFYLNGSGQTTSDGKFKWSFPTGRNFDSMDQFSALPDSSTNDLTEVKIRSTGVYFVYAKVTINGRSRRDSLVKPAVGIFLRRRRNYGNQDVDEELDSSWLTQDERGIRTYTQSGYSGDIIDTQYPVDTLSVQGLFRLEANDRIYIQKPKDALYDPAGERYVNGLKYSRFAAYLVESGQSYG